MKIETIDLYEYFKAERKNGESRGFLTAYRHGQMSEMRSRKLRPAMLILPGGGYGFLSQRENEPIALRYFAEGFDAFVLDYDIAPVAYPAQIVQAAMAMLYLRREAERLDLDCGHIAAVGFSAGGHLCGCISLLWDDPAVRELFGSECEKVRPDAAILSYPVVTADKNFWHEGSFRNFCGEKVSAEEYSLEKKVRPSAPPCFIWATTEDDCVPAENAWLLYGALHRAGVSSELHLFEKGWHGLSTCDIEVNDERPQQFFFGHVAHWFGLSLEFLREHGFEVRPMKE